MASNRWKLNPNKAQFIWMGTWQQLANGDSSSVALGSSTLKCQSTVIDLGVIIENQLTLKDHIRHTSTLIRCMLHRMRVLDARTELTKLLEAGNASATNKLLPCTHLDELGFVGIQLPSVR